ncbi:phage scaffolding protein [Clostridium neonatale]|uniref:phage scaffolding protein n=1 Tax=Clostridium neonatale TaxID=137838 RepID=UPI00291BE5D0|nr:phage scaffolding protein [Clostridium neonatale]CAI3573337.1 Phage minor structural protein GP20 [Clostridium neonatale]CAI3654614.1 Phage minor structural protein GP20 [Clostridium neonatale]
MERKFLEGLELEGGVKLSKEVIDKIMDENGKDINKAKGDYDEVKTQLDTANKTIKERDTQLETLKKSTGDNEELKKQIESLQEDNKKKDDDYQAQIKELQISNAIKLAISDKAQDADLVASLFDKSKLILGDDGKITGLEEQLKTIKEGKPFLFKEDTQQQQQNNFKGVEQVIQIRMNCLILIIHKIKHQVLRVL